MEIEPLPRLYGLPGPELPEAGRQGSIFDAVAKAFEGLAMTVREAFATVTAVFGDLARAYVAVQTKRVPPPPRRKQLIHNGRKPPCQNPRR